MVPRICLSMVMNASRVSTFQDWGGSFGGLQTPASYSSSRCRRGASAMHGNGCLMESDGSACSILRTVLLVYENVCALLWGSLGGETEC